MRNKESGFVVKLVIVVLALVAAAWAAYYFTRPTAIVMPAVKGLATNAAPGSVTVNAEYQMDLKTEAGGRVLKSELEPGKTVKKGDFLVQLDPTDLKLEIESIENDFETHKKTVAVGSATKFELEAAQEELANDERLFNRGSLPEVELTRQQRAVKQIQQRMALEEVANQQRTQNFESTLKLKRRALEKMTVTAPFNGVISLVYTHPGDLIGQGTALATVITTTRTVEAKISEENFAGVQVGQKASVRFLAYGPQLYGASVDKVLPTADPETQRYIVYLSVDLPPEKLVPGLTGEVSIVTGQRQANAIIPRRALRGKEVMVYEEGRVHIRKVEPGFVLLNAAEILSGLKTGDLVVVENLDQFQDGDRVRAEQPKQP